MPARVRSRCTSAREVSLDLENVAGTGETSGFDDAEATFALSQVIELGDKRESRIGLGQAGRDAMTIDRAAAQLDVLADVAHYSRESKE